MTSLEVLKNQFGYSSFRLEQEQIIDSILRKKDTFILMPTGGGKSLCYQIPALMLEGLTLVISPLIALMKDQVDALRVNGIEAAYLNSTQSYQDQRKIIDHARLGKLKLLYVAPERLIRYDASESKESAAPSATLQTLLSLKISLVAIDEAHCISQWGHDFRPEYLMLSQLKKSLPGVPVIALTATADKLTRKDILEKLQFDNPAVFVSSFNRPNIRYTVEPKRNSFDRLVEFLQSRQDEAGIIYCLSRASTVKLAQDLCDVGFDALPYHAGLDREERMGNQEKFLRDEVKIIVATIAFGMGINKSNVRFVVHMDLPKNIESYYQETGRAGRDGLDSEALLFFSYGDVSKLKSFARVEGNEEQTRISFQKLDHMAAYGDLTSCRRKYLLNYFDENTSTYCGNCDVCLTTVELYDGTNEAWKVLTAVSSLQGRFGTGYIIDILKGSNSVKISAEHKQFEIYGKGVDLNRDEWTVIIQDMLDRGLLHKSKGMYPLISLTALGEEILHGKKPVMLTKSKEKVAGTEQYSKNDYDPELLVKLKGLRRAIAADENVPAYIVLSDATLMEMATYLPEDKNDLKKISGFGEIKLQRYGDFFADAISLYCELNNVQSRMAMKSPRQVRKEVPERDNDTKRETLALFRKGNSIQEVAQKRELAVTTIEGHLSYYISKGQLDLSEIMPDSEISMIRKAISEAQGGLTSIKEILGDDFSYGKIRMVIADQKKEKEKLET